MPSWAVLSTSPFTSTSHHHPHDLNTSNPNIDQGHSAHVRNNGPVQGDDKNNGNKAMRNGSGGSGSSNNGNGSHITMPWSNHSFSSLSSSFSSKGKGKHPKERPTCSVTGLDDDNAGDKSDIPHHSSGDIMKDCAEEDEEQEQHTDRESDSSMVQLSTEETEALLWDAQMALIAHQYQTGVALLEKAAKGGSSTACLSLANIYHKGLPCSTHPHIHHKKHASSSPSKLIEGSISTDQVKTASYLLQALELEAAKPDYDALDLEVLSDASLLLCNMFRYGKIRPRDPSRTQGPMRELSVSPRLKKSNSFLNPIIDDSMPEQSESAWNRGGKLAKLLTEKIKLALEKRGITWLADYSNDISGDHDPVRNSTSSSLQDSDVERLDIILVCLYYIIALVTGSREGTEAVEESIQYWKLLLASHAVFSDLYMSKAKSKSKSNKNGGIPPTRSSSRSSPKLDDLVTKAEKRLQLLIAALEESQKQLPNGSNVRPRDIVLRRDTSEYSASMLFSPTSESSMNFGSSHTNSLKEDSPNSRLNASQQSIDTACSCELPVPSSPEARNNGQGRPAPDKTPQKRRTAKFAIHDSPVSIMSLAPPPSARGGAHLHAPTSRQKTVPTALFRGFQNSSRSNLRDSLTAQSTSSSHLSLADLASSASSIAPSTYRRPGDLRRPLLDRKASQVSLASTTAFGRRAWAGPAGKPLNRVSNLSSASLHILAPTTDKYMSESGVLSLPHHNTTKSQPVNAAQVLSSLRASTSAATPSPSNYTGRFKNVVSSLGSFFTSASANDSATDASKAKAELEKVAEQHDAEVENFYCWEEDRTSSEEESLHSGTPSNKGDGDSVVDDTEGLHRTEDSMPDEDPALLSASHSRQVRTVDGIPTRPVYPLSTSISSSYLHSSTPRSSPRRGGMPTFPSTTTAQSPSKDARPPTTTEVKPSATPSAPALANRPSRRVNENGSSNKPAKIDPLLAALEAASRVNVKSRCAVCGIQGVNFPACQKCGITFCSRDCRVASGGDAGRHVCQSDQSQPSVLST
ncbi:hypothetical protein P389DRAFT_65837 [Cystobasidium minutum MCA 4210]|uniref:uncharacterized protein n=1 Tax=Cystobasidium minutum MCA 4210 TaxID=1397322 RepID=UPI0034CD9119|eukprot:jgi/Rhomi1/65837/CE65836_1491